MGYELKLYIVEPTSVTGKEGTYCSVIAMVDICKPGYESGLYELDRTSNNSQGYYFYADNGNTLIRQDSYGSKIRYAPLEEVLKCVQEDNKKDRYRRFDILLACLKAVKKGKFRNPMVAFYGY